MNLPELMTAGVLYGKEDVRIERLPTPLPGPGEVLVKVETALTCGTDLKVYRRGYHARMITPPIPFGHEYAGTIAAIGEGVTAWQVGERVVGANSAACDKCFYCERGNPELCEDLLFVNGAYAEFILLPERLVRRNLLRIPDHLPFAAAAMTEPLACVVRGLQFTPISRGDVVTVLGTGPIGLMFIRLAHLCGARVIAIGRGKARLQTAAQLGASMCISTLEKPDIVTEIKALTNGGRGSDFVIECVGQPATWDQAIRMTRPAGTVNLFGGCPKDTFVQVDTGMMHYSEITLKAAFHHTPEAVREALSLLESGMVPYELFIQQQAPLVDLPNVLAEMAGGGAAIKTAIIPGQD